MGGVNAAGAGAYEFVVGTDGRGGSYGLYAEVAADLVGGSYRFAGLSGTGVRRASLSDTGAAARLSLIIC